MTIILAQGHHGGSGEVALCVFSFCCTLGVPLQHHVPTLVVEVGPIAAPHRPRLSAHSPGFAAARFLNDNDMPFRNGMIDPAGVARIVRRRCRGRALWQTGGGLTGAGVAAGDVPVASVRRRRFG